MHFSTSAIAAVAAFLSVAEALPHYRHQAASDAVADSGSDNPLAGWLSSLLGALPTGSGSGFPGFGSGSGSGLLPTDGAAFTLLLPTGGSGGADSTGLGSFPTASVDFPSGIFPTETATVPTGGLPAETATAPTGGSGEPNFGSGGGIGAPTSTPTSTVSSPAGISPSNSVLPTGGVTTPTTTAPATLPTSAEEIDWSTFSFVFASSTADSPFGNFPGFGKK